MRIILIALSVALAVALAYWQDANEMNRASSGVRIDPFVLPVIPITPYGPTNYNTTGLTPRATQATSSAIRNLVIIGAGQSNMSDTAPTAYTASNPTKLDQFNVNDGTVYPAIEPLLGTTQFPGVTIGNPIYRLADQLITNNKFDRIILVPLAIGATSVAVWETGICKDRIAVALRRLAARGIASGTNVTVIVLWGQGENDGATSQSAYTNSLNAVIANGNAGGTIDRWFIAKQSFDGTTTHSAIQNAQAAVLGGNVKAGADADALTGTACGGVACRNATDLIHWTDAGSAYYAGTSGSGGWLAALTASGAPF